MECYTPMWLRKKEMVVPCGKCNFCLQNKRSDWSLRLAHEQKSSSSAFFLTITYDDDNLPWNTTSGLSEVRKRDVQLFKKRLRKAQAAIGGGRLRYYTVAEYGTEFDRPHYHSIMFNMHTDLLGFAPRLLVNNEAGIWSPELSALWKGGIVHVGNCNADSIGYVTKYVLNRVGDYWGRNKPFALMSRKPGIGHDYIAKHTEWHHSGLKNYAQVDGVKLRLPRYYKERVFTDQSQRSAISNSTRALVLEKYSEKLEDLKKFHSDPFEYHLQRIDQAHDLIYKRLNDKNKF